MQGFLINSHEQIRELQKYCQYLYVDKQLSKELNFKVKSNASNDPKSSSTKPSFNPP